jgi:membrane fusion protein, copper/silver efflux system
MSERNLYRQSSPGVNGVVTTDEGGLRLPPGLSLPRKVWWWCHFLILVKLARLRFIAVLAVIGLAIANWDTLRAHYEKWTRPSSEQAAAASDLEFWCPMHPSIIRDHPDKCPICAMPLSKRKKGKQGNGEALPPGVVSRVQLTPYRIALAGIATAEVGYRELSREIRAVGFVEFDETKLARITARASGKNRIDKLHVNYTGQDVARGEPLAELYSPDLAVTVQTLLGARRGNDQEMLRLTTDRLRLWGIEQDQIEQILRTGKPITHITLRSPISGHVIRKYQVEGDYVEEGTPLYDIAELSTVWIEPQFYQEDVPFLKVGLQGTVTIDDIPGRTFAARVSFVHPHMDAATRTLRVRFEAANPGHVLRPGMYATVTLKVPVPQLDQFQRGLLKDWAYGTLGEVTAHALFAPALPAVPGLESLLHTAVESVCRQQGLALAVSERAVIDTGRRKIVYREVEPSVYEGVLVDLGPRSDGFYPVVRGLKPGDRVATAGSFLIDAETRLAGGLGSTYFGASGGPQDDHRSATTAARPSMAEDEDTKIQASLARLSSLDRRLAEEQGFCPVRQGNRLGVMGKPVKLMLQGKPVFLCCSGCLETARAKPEQTLRKVEQLRGRYGQQGGRP